MYLINTSIQDFLDSIYVRSHSEESVYTYQNGIRKFENFIDEKYKFSLTVLIKKLDENKNDVYQIFREFVIHQDKLGMKPRTIAVTVNAVKSYLRHCGIKIYTEDFRHQVRMPMKLKTPETPLTKDTLLRLLRNVSPKLQTILLVAISTGMRIGELVQLQTSDIDFEFQPTKITLRAETTKTRVGREVFLTGEATISLKDYLSRYHQWKEHEPNSHLIGRAIFSSTSIKKYKTKKNKKTKCSPVMLSKTLLQKTLLTAIRKVPELDIRNSDGTNAIHFHAFRKYFRTVVGNAVGRDFAEALMGHGFYLDTYYQLSEEKKQEMYLDAEPHLTISDFQAVEKNIKKLSIKNSQLEEKFNDLLQYLRSNSIEVQHF